MSSPMAVDGQRRHVGAVRGRQPGPCTVVMTGIHGNEGSGVLAATRVLEAIERLRLPLAGELVVLAGNLKALRARTRFIDRDLNRHWTPERVARVRALAGTESAEDEEQLALLQVFAEVVARADGPVHFVDLHTSSAEGAPFVTVGDTLRNREFVRGLPLPIMLGLEEQVDGSLLEYLNNFGLVTMGVEAGQHDAPSSVDRHEAVVWLALCRAGMLAEQDIPELETQRALLRDACRETPPVLEVRYRHVIRPGDAFRMNPGYDNFRPIRRGELLAHDIDGPIHAPMSGRILLPLYQGLGDDGFFIAREFSPFWLGLSSSMRRMGLGSLMPLLPGVRRHPEDQEILLVDTRVARFFPMQIFHLLGFRKLRSAGDLLLVSRRRYDRSPPEQIQFG